MRALAYLALCLLLGLAGPAESRGTASPGIGPRGPEGAQGPQGEPGPQGVPGQRGAKGEKGDAGPQGSAGPKGEPGATGPAGPKASTLVCTATIAETITLGISSGIRQRDGVACPGVLTTDLLEVYPTAPAAFPAGYAVHHALPSAANTFRAVLSVPALAIGATYSIPVAVYAVNR